MDTTAQHARDISDNITDAINAILETEEKLHEAVTMIREDFYSPGDDDNLVDAIGALRIIRKNIMADDIRWNGYATARAR